MPQVVICGFGRVGKIVAKMLAAQKIPYVAIDLSVNAVMLGREAGYNVVYGNSTNADVLRCLGLNPKHTRAVVVALDNATTASNTVLTAKSIAPRVKIFARARNLADSKMLLKEGAAEALPETMESSLYLGYGLLEHLGISYSKIDALLVDMRANNYEQLNSISEIR